MTLTIKNSKTRGRELEECKRELKKERAAPAGAELTHTERRLLKKVDSLTQQLEQQSNSEKCFPKINQRS